MKFAIAISLLVLFVSCEEQQTEFESQEEFDEYLSDPENGYVLAENTSEMVFEARLIPPMKGEKGRECTVQLRISRKDGGSVLDYGKVSKEEVLIREGYLSFDLIDDVSLNFGGEKLKPHFHHYERNYGLKPSIDMYFNFKDFKINSEASFSYRDELFGQGLIKLKFNKDLFNKCYVAKS